LQVREIICHLSAALNLVSAQFVTLTVHGDTCGRDVPS